MCWSVLHPGDHALGYDLANANLVNLDYEAHVNRGGAVPDVMLVRKSYEEKRKKTRGKGRAWKLRQLPIEAGEDRWVVGGLGLLGAVWPGAVQLRAGPAGIVMCLCDCFECAACMTWTSSLV